MNQNPSKIQFRLWGIALLLTLGAALFFRTYPLRSEWLVSEKLLNRKAETLVREQIRKQLESRFTASPAEPAEGARKKLVDQKLDAMMKTNPALFEDMTRRMSGEMARRHKSAFSFRYLSEADPYYYLNMTQNVVAGGKLGPRIEGGRFLNPLRHAPQGNPDVINLHPYVGAGIYTFLKMVRPGITLMQATGLTPLFLVTAAAAAYFALWPLLGLRLFSFWLSSLVFFLSPIVIQRSTLGWYDTDPYNLIFPTLITFTFLGALKQPRRAVPLALIGGFLTGFYPLFWQGWAYILPLVACASWLAGFFCLVRLRTAERFAAITYAALYTSASLGFAALFMTPSGFWDTVLNSLLYSSKVQGGSTELWPNLLVLVGETGAVTFKKWVYLTSHYGIILLALLGMILPCLRRRMTLTWGVIVLMAVPLFIFSFAAERFAILAVLPLSLLAGYGIEEILGLTKTAADFVSRKRKLLGPVIRWTAAAALLAAVIPRTLLGAHVSGLNSHFIMNDAWFGALSELKETAPQDSIVHSWWPPGYFVNAVSGLRTVVDGGSQHQPENFWMAKAFMARDEKTALGIFRMVAAGGNQAMAFLEKRNIRGDQAVELLLKMAVLPRAQAAALLSGPWSLKDKEVLLDLTHGKKDLPPSYVLIYEDMMTQNLAMQVIDGWSFERARKIFMENSKPGGVKGFFAGKGAADYTRKMLEVTGHGLPYEAPAGVAARQDGKIIFKNGITFDTRTGLAVFTGPKGAMPVRSIFKRDGKWSAVVPPVGNGAVAALIIPENGTFACVTAHSDLVTALLFKLAYLEGQGLTQFESVIQQGSILGKDYVRIYRILWE